MSEFIQLTTTAGSREEAERIAQVLVARRLAACAQVSGPIHSTYWWQGKMETAAEWQCLAKTRRSLFSAAAQAIREIHSYAVPEIVALPLIATSQSYGEWMSQELASEAL